MAPVPPGAGKDDIEHWLSSTRDELEASSQAAEEAADALSDLTVSAETDGGAVRATVTASGALRELTLGDLVRDWAPERIARQVLECVQRAQAGLAGATRDALATAPGGPAVAGLVADQLQAAFPSPAPTAAAPRRPVPAEEEDDLVPVILPEPKGWR